jgi:hypothetical protein
LEFSRKIKKAKKDLKNIKFKGEDYEVENWAQCDKCHIWRKLQKGKPVKSSSAFFCRDTGKLCHKKDKQDKATPQGQYIVL